VTQEVKKTFLVPFEQIKYNKRRGNRKCLDWRSAWWFRGWYSEAFVKELLIKGLNWALYNFKKGYWAD